MPKQTTARQREVLAAIKARERRAGPTLREVGDALGIAPNGVRGHAVALRAAGLLEPERGDGLVVAANGLTVAKIKAAQEVLAAPARPLPSAKTLLERPAPRAPILKPSAKTL